MSRYNQYLVSGMTNVQIYPERYQLNTAIQLHTGIPPTPTYDNDVDDVNTHVPIS